MRKDKTMVGVKIFAIAGKAGSGKDTIIKKLMEKYNSKFHKIVSCTTRPKREGEIDGVDYHFVTPEQFDDTIENGEMIEWTTFRGWKYGTRVTDLNDMDGIINIGTFNPGGVRQLRKYSKNILTTQVFLVAASDKNRLLRQLQRENNPDVQEIIRRFGTDQEDFQDFDYDVILRNDIGPDLDECISILNCQCCWAIDYN